MTHLLRTYRPLQIYLELKAKYLLAGSKNVLGKSVREKCSTRFTSINRCLKSWGFWYNYIYTMYVYCSIVARSWNHCCGENKIEHSVLFYIISYRNDFQKKKLLNICFHILWNFRSKHSSHGHTTCQRPYHVETTGSPPIFAVKQRWASLELGLVTAWEHHVLLALILYVLFLNMRPRAGIRTGRDK